MLVVAQTVCLIPSRSKCAWLRGSLTRAIALRDAVALLADLRDDEVVLVVARDREQELRRTRDARALEHADLSRVAPHHHRAELLLETGEPVRALLDQRDLVAHLEQRTRDVRADLPSAGDDDVHQPACGAGDAGLHRLEKDGDRGLRRAHGVEPALRVERRARGVEDADDDRARSVPPLQHLPDDDVRVVAGGGDDRSVRLGDSGPLRARWRPCRGR